MYKPLKIFLINILLISYSCTPKKAEKNRTEIESNLISYSIKITIPHDNKAFTQGLVIHKDKIYESTGRENSYLAEIDVHSGEIIKKVDLDSQYFGEGITVLNNKLYQLTWTTQTGFIYEPETLKRIGTFNYESEGWGLTTDGNHLIMSDGSNKLYYLDTIRFERVKTLNIKEKNIPVNNLNELEFRDGFIYANQWETNFIYKIDPSTEKVVGKLNLSPLVNEIKRKNPEADVLNGIAYNKATGDFLITGKLWPKSYWIRINDQ